MIYDQDCDVDLPCPVDEQYISEGGMLEGPQASPFLALVHVVRSVGQLTKALRSPVLSPATLETFERHFTACLATLPLQYHPKSDQYLEPRSLVPIIFLQNSRFILHRHNLSPACSHDARLSAMDYCLSIALDTTRLLSRCMQNPPTSSSGNASTGATDWRVLLASSASTMLCTHICRCLLLLLFRQEYAASLICIRACAVIGDSRAANMSSGRYIAFFLGRILDRLRRNTGNWERDEEIVAYMSGDMQGTADSSWIWQGSDETGQQPEDSSNVTTRSSSSSQKGTEILSLPEQESEWQGWDWVERTVQYLLDEKRQQEPRDDKMDDVQPQQQPSRPDQSLLSPESAESSDNSAGRSNSAHSRMTIASII